MKNCAVCKEKINYKRNVCYKCFSKKQEEEFTRDGGLDEYLKNIGLYLGLHYKPKKIMCGHALFNIKHEFYIRDNPWKLSSHNDFQKFHRFCVFCGMSKYSPREWCRGNFNKDIYESECKYCDDKYNSGRLVPHEFWSVQEWEKKYMPSKFFGQLEIPSGYAMYSRLNSKTIKCVECKGETYYRKNTSQCYECYPKTLEEKNDYFYSMNLASENYKMAEKVKYGNVELYLKNNPWKLSIRNNIQKYHKFCVFCGKKRSEWWGKIHDKNRLGPLHCYHCDLFNKLDGCVPNEFIILQKWKLKDYLHTPRTDNFEKYLSFEERKLDISGIIINEKYRKKIMNLIKYNIPSVLYVKLWRLYWIHLKRNFKYDGKNNYDDFCKKAEKKDDYLRFLIKLIGLAREKAKQNNKRKREEVENEPIDE
jgi:hypothetical protein